MNEWMNLHRKNGKEEDFELNLQKVEIIKELKKVQVLFLPNLIGISPKISYCISFLSIVTFFLFFWKLIGQFLRKNFSEINRLKSKGRNTKMILLIHIFPEKKKKEKSQIRNSSVEDKRQKSVGQRKLALSVSPTHSTVDNEKDLLVFLPLSPRVSGPFLFISTLRNDGVIKPGWQLRGSKLDRRER